MSTSEVAHAVGPLAVGIDIGGTKIAAGVVDSAGHLLDQSRCLTPTTDARAVSEAVVALVAGLRRDHDVAAVGIGAAGYIDADREHVVFSPHVPWRHEPLRAAVAQRVGLPIVIDNDANFAAWAEWRFGAARGLDTVVQVNLGTGIGGAVVLDGRLYRGHHGMAGEFGHQCVVPEGRACECGNRGCWEQYASGRVLDRWAVQAVADQTPMGEALVGAAGAPGLVDGATVGQLAALGDPIAREWLSEVGQWLGWGLANLAAVFDPAVFVVGGGLISNGDLLLDPARTAFAAALTGRGFRPETPIVPAALGSDAGIIGAAIGALDAQ